MTTFHGMTERPAPAESQARAVAREIVQALGSLAHEVRSATFTEVSDVTRSDAAAKYAFVDLVAGGRNVRLVHDASADSWSLGVGGRTPRAVRRTRGLSRNELALKLALEINLRIRS